MNQLTQDAGSCKSANVVVYSTCPDVETADQIAHAVLERKLAACVNQISGVVSMYRWQGQIQRDNECLLMIKTSEDCLTALMQQIETMHPYELPEIIAVPIVRGSAPYLNWIQECVTKDQ